SERRDIGLAVPEAHCELLVPGADRVPPIGSVKGGRQVDAAAVLDSGVNARLLADDPDRRQRAPLRRPRVGGAQRELGGSEKAWVDQAQNQAVADMQAERSERVWLGDRLVRPCCVR